MQFPLGKLKTRLELRTDIKYCAWLRLNRMTCTYFILAGLSVLCVRAFFPGWFSIVPPDRRLRISGSMHTAGVVRTLKWARRCTSNKISHTLPVCQEEKGLGKKKELLSASWWSALWSTLCLFICSSIYLSNVWLGFTASLCTSVRNNSVESTAWVASQVEAYKCCRDRERGSVSCADACRH